MDSLFILTLTFTGGYYAVNRTALGSKALNRVEFPSSKILGPEASVDEIKALIKECGQVFIKPIFKGGVGKKGKSGLIGRVDNITDALSEKERLYFAEHTVGNIVSKADGVTFEGGVTSRARDILLNWRLYRVSRPDHDNHPSRRC